MAFGVGRCHQCRRLFVAHLDKSGCISNATKRTNNPIDAIARIAIDAVNIPFFQSFNQKIADSSHSICFLSSSRGE
jgi:hypothetical protein